MKTIAIFQGYFLPHIGGIERYTYNLAKTLKNKGYKIIIVTTKYQKDLNTKEELEYATVYRLPIYKIFSERYPIIKKDREYKKIIKELEGEKIDSIILNTRFQLTTLVGAKFARKNKVPCCVIEHGSSHFTVYNKVLDFFGHIYEHLLTNRVKSLVEDFYGVSNACVEWLKHYKINSKGFFYNAIDGQEYDIYKDKKYVKNDNEKIKVLFAGRLIKDKGILLLIEAFKELSNKYKNIELIIAGEGPLKELIIKEGNVIYIGNLSHDEIMALYNQSDIFINPSYSEGLPTAILEAGLMKCAIIATPVGGTIEIVQDGKNGIFCDTTVSSIIEKIELLINNKQLIKKFSENIHNTIQENFTWDKTAKKIIENIDYKKEK